MIADRTDKNRTICIDPHGDLTLVVGLDEVRMRVDANVLRRPSKIFNRMLFGPFLESERTADWTVKLPEDDPEALKVILNADMGRVPLILELCHFYRITVMAHKYRMVGLLLPWAPTWTSTPTDLRNFEMDETSYEDIQRLCVMSYFGTIQQFKPVIINLILKSRTDPGGKLLFRMMSNTDEGHSEGNPEGE